MEQLSKEVLQAFGEKVEVLRTVQRYASYICKIDGKEVCIKKFKGTEEEALFVHNVKQKLKSKGFTSLDAGVLTLAGNPYLVYNDEIYFCNQYVEGEKIDFTNQTNMLFLMAELGRLHKALNSTYIKTGKELRFNIKGDLERFAKLKRQVSKTNKKNDIDFTFLKSYSKYEGLIKETIEDFEYLDFENYEKTSISLGDICFNSYDDNNFIIENNSLTFFDFSNVKAGVQLLDVAGLVYKYIKICEEEKIKPININYIIEAYKRNNELTSRELLILKAILRYPQKYLENIFRYYEKKRSFVPTETVTKLQKHNELEEVYYYYIDEIEV